jgi:hypothetical protein
MWRLALSPTASLLLRIERRGRAEPTCCISATQSHFLLSRAQVRLFYRLLIEAKSILRHDTMALSKHSEQDPRCTESTLQEKICFVPRSVHLQFPALLAVTALSLELTLNELETLEIQVMYLAQDLDTSEATWFIAKSFEERLQHLVRKEQRIRTGSVLCGCLPPPPSENVGAKGWLFFPIVGQMKKDHLCPACWQRWEREPQPAAFIPMEQSSRQQGGEVWYEI